VPAPPGPGEQEIGNKKQETGNRQPATGNGRTEATRPSRAPQTPHRRGRVRAVLAEAPRMAASSPAARTGNSARCESWVESSDPQRRRRRRRGRERGFRAFAWPRTTGGSVDLSLGHAPAELPVGSPTPTASDHFRLPVAGCRSPVAVSETGNRAGARGGTAFYWRSTVHAPGSRAVEVMGARGLKREREREPERCRSPGSRRRSRSRSRCLPPEARWVAGRAGL
jgi:hypothetical protein